MKLTVKGITFFLGIIAAGMLAASLFVNFTGCTSQNQSTVTTTATSTIVVSSTSTSVETGELKAAWPNKEWTKILSEELDNYGSSLLTSYPEGACGNRKQFYVMLISEMARYESSFNPKSDYEENFEDSKGNPQISRGLLQLSFDDAKNNGRGCDFKKIDDLYDVRLNLRCGVRILSRWVANDNVVAAGSTRADAKGGARYWSVLRTGKKKDAIFAAARATCK